jgi:hypothetical protein
MHRLVGPHDRNGIRHILVRGGHAVADDACCSPPAGNKPGNKRSERAVRDPHLFELTLEIPA